MPVVAEQAVIMADDHIAEVYREGGLRLSGGGMGAAAQQ
jgi:hypothetical protein